MFLDLILVKLQHRHVYVGRGVAGSSLRRALVLVYYLLNCMDLVRNVPMLSDFVNGIDIMLFLRSRQNFRLHN